MTLTRVATYTNPIYPHYFADPFVPYQGIYYAYGTGLTVQTNGCVFEVLRSTDLIDWRSCGV